MQTTQHFLLTRFNVTDKVQFTAGLDEQWLGHRFELFSRYCLPSIMGQRSPDFCWLVHFDARTAPTILDRFRELASRLDAAVVLVDPSGASLRERACEAISERLLPTTEKVLTSRVDNDDALADDYMLRAREALEGEASAFATFSNGFEWGGERLYQRKYPLSPFVNRIEPAADFRSVWEAKHRRVHLFGDWIQIDGPPAWIQVVHGENISNVIRGRRVPRSGVKAAGKFPREMFDADLQESRLSVMIDRWNPFSRLVRRLKETWIRHS